MVSRKNIWWSAFFAVISALLATGALAHHGRAWTTGKNTKLTGLIEQARLDNPMVCSR